ncbi:hypothetical protein EES39_04450 [Streptomyces sp. ADI92-24]|nr:hypothetical protein EDD95_7546 [Streptomyces sp. CEV 2-1]RPK51480.1 hypothetical protein EES39_04450 [Streptomyces sp. ADI92-24]
MIGGMSADVPADMTPDPEPDPRLPRQVRIGHGLGSPRTGTFAVLPGPAPRHHLAGVPAAASPWPPHRSRAPLQEEPAHAD